MTSPLLSDTLNDLKECVSFHGHLCPGLVYGYRVAKEAMRLLDISRSPDEEIVAISENDSCAVDGLQVLLGTTAGKGNLIIRNHGKNVYTIQSRKQKKAVRFSRIFEYQYQGEFNEEFERLEKKVANKTAEPHEMKRQKHLKAMDLAHKDISLVFNCQTVDYEEIDYAPLAPSTPCQACGELTMKTRMIQRGDGEHVCAPCSTKL